MSETAPGTLFEALARFQASLPKIAEGRAGKVEGVTQQGKPFSYPIKWADLADVSDAVLPRLGAVGLAFISRPTVREDGKFGLAYSLVHASGEREDGFYELRADLTPQKTGALITYARRYCLCAVTGVAAGDDAETARQSGGDAWETASRERPRPQNVPAGDDTRSQPRDGGAQPGSTGEGAAQDPAPRAAGAAPPRGAQPPPPAPDDEPGSASKTQLTKLHTILTGLGFGGDEREQKLVIAEVITGRAPLTGPVKGRSSGNLSANEARKLIDTLDGFGGDRDKLIAFMARQEQAGDDDA